MDEWNCVIVFLKWGSRLSLVFCLILGRSREYWIVKFKGLCDCMIDFFFFVFVFLVVGIFVVFIVMWMGLGFVLGYLMVGIVISFVLVVLGVDVIFI